MPALHDTTPDDKDMCAVGNAGQLTRWLFPEVAALLAERVVATEFHVAIQ